MGWGSSGNFLKKKRGGGGGQTTYLGQFVHKIIKLGGGRPPGLTPIDQPLAYQVGHELAALGHMLAIRSIHTSVYAIL